MFYVTRVSPPLMHSPVVGSMVAAMSLVPSRTLPLMTRRITRALQFGVVLATTMTHNNFQQAIDSHDINFDPGSSTRIVVAAAT